MLCPAILLLALAAPSQQQEVLESPCPSIIQFEPLAPHDQFFNRWNATITLPPGGKWNYLRIVLDKKAYLLGTTHGEVTTKDNIVFTIDNPESMTPYSQSAPRPPIWIFVNYGNEPPPKVQAIWIDGNQICQSNDQNYVEAPTTRNPSPQPYPYKSTTSAPVTPGWDLEPKASLPEPDQVPQCGKVKLENPVGLAVGGQPTQEGQWPWQVAIYKQQTVNIIFQCGGTLVSRHHVITAAHCTTVQKEGPFEALHPALLTVRLGKHHLFYSKSGYQTLDVSKVIVHPDYKIDSLYARDLSILEFSKPAVYTDRVQPACLWPNEMADLSYIVGRNGMVVGWGNDGSGNLLLVEMPVVNQETCIRAKPEFYARTTSDYTYCAGSRNGSSACNGDSGGGMVFRIKGTWYLRGVVSHSPTRPNENVCDPSYYVVFTDLAKFLPWIRENIPFDSY